MGCSEMDHSLNHLEKEIVTVAFGGDWDTYFVVFEDGSWECNGDIPLGLSDKLHAREERGDLACVSLGPTGEWFLMAQNGRMWWGGLSDELFEELEQISDSLTFMDFGDDGSYIVRYTE